MTRPPRWLVITLALGLPALGLAGAWFYLAQRQRLQGTASTNLPYHPESGLPSVRAASVGDLEAA